MTTDLNVLMVEDSESDAFLILRKLREAEYKVTHQRVQSHDDMRRALESKTWDIVLSDYVMPQFSGLLALDLVHEMGLDIPFIVISGQIGEDVAVEAMRAGASDYLMKGNLKRLGSAIARELVEAENRRERRRAERELIKSELELRSLSHRLIQMQEEERLSLARELHDEIGHNLAFLRLIVDRYGKTNGKEAQELLNEATTMLSGLIDQVRNISLNLRPPMLEEDGLTKALNYLLERQMRDTGLKIDMSSAELPGDVSWGVNLALYRVVQESMTNIIKHAKASAVKIDLSHQKGNIKLAITDNGVGFTPQNTRSSSGLRGMRERVEILGGNFRIDSKPGSGTTVIALIPTANSGSIRVPSTI